MKSIVFDLDKIGDLIKEGPSEELEIFEAFLVQAFEAQGMYLETLYGSEWDLASSTSAQKKPNKDLSNRKELVRTAKISAKDPFVTVRDEEDEPMCEAKIKNGQLFFTESNQGTSWLCCIKNEDYEAGAFKRVHPISWILTIKDSAGQEDLPTQVVYKDVLEKYVAVMFKEKSASVPATKSQISEFQKTHEKNERIKPLLYTETEGLVGFVMPDLGRNLTYYIGKDSPYSLENQTRIMLQCVSKVHHFLSEGLTHGDLKLENMLFKTTNGGSFEISFIDWAGQRAIADNSKGNNVYTKEFTHPTFLKKRDYLDQGQYRIFHELWTTLHFLTPLYLQLPQKNQEEFMGFISRWKELLKKCELYSKAPNIIEMAQKSAFVFLHRIFENLQDILNDFNSPVQNSAAVHVENAAEENKNDPANVPTAHNPYGFHQKGPKQEVESDIEMQSDVEMEDVNPNLQM